MQLAQLNIPNYDSILEEKTQDAKNIVKTQSRNFYGKLEKALQPLGYACGSLSFKGGPVAARELMDSIPSFDILKIFKKDNEEKQDEKIATLEIIKGRLFISPEHLEPDDFDDWATDHENLSPATIVDFIKKYFGE